MRIDVIFSAAKTLIGARRSRKTANDLMTIVLIEGVKVIFGGNTEDINLQFIIQNTTQEKFNVINKYIKSLGYEMHLIKTYEQDFASDSEAKLIGGKIYFINKWNDHLKNIRVNGNPCGGQSSRLT